MWDSTLCVSTPVNTKHFYNIEDVVPTLYKCYTNVLCVLGVPGSLFIRVYSGPVQVGQNVLVAYYVF